MNLDLPLLAICALLVAGCVAASEEARHPQSTRAPNVQGWLLRNIDQPVCVKGPVDVSIHSRSFDLPKPSGVIAPYDGKLELPFSQGEMMRRGIGSGDIVTACGRLRADPINPSCRATFCRNFRLEEVALDS